MNVAILQGYLGGNPETTVTAKGMANTRFSIAVNERWTERETGEIKERTDWFYIVTFGKLAEICGKHLAKGREVTIQGKFRVDEKEIGGVKKKYYSVVATDVHFGARPKSQESGHNDGHEDFEPSPTEDGELPF